jgi:hypothetical protein
MAIGTTHILHAKFQRPAEKIKGLSIKNRCEEEGLGNEPTMTNQWLVKDAHSLKYSGFRRVRARGLNPPCQPNERPRLPMTL